MRLKFSKFEAVLCLVIFLPFCFSASLNAAFDDIGAGARVQAMAGAFTGISDDVYSVYYNSAGLNRIKNTEIATTYGKIYASLSDCSDLGDTDLFFALPRNFGTLAGGVKVFSLAGFYNENRLFVSYARKFEFAQVGISVKRLTLKYHSTLYTDHSVVEGSPGVDGGADPVFASGMSKSAFAVDVGFLKKFGKISAGFTLSNLNRPNIALAGGYKLPVRVKLGVGATRKDYLFDFDLVRENGFNTLRVGAELTAAKNFVIRGGFEYGENLANLSAGFGYQINIFSFDYAYTLPLSGIEGTFGTHHIGVVVKFGKVEEEKEKPRRKRKVRKPRTTLEEERLKLLAEDVLKDLRRLYLYGIAAERRKEFSASEKYFQQMLVYDIPSAVSDVKEIREMIKKAKAKLEDVSGKQSQESKSEDKKK